MRIGAVREALLAHARREAPNECCGLVGLRDEVAERAIEVTNVHASPFRFEMEPREQLRAMTELDEAGLDLAIYHSHTRSAPYPSETDVNLARLWPGVAWVIVGLKGAEGIRAFAIDGAEISELELD